MAEQQPTLGDVLRELRELRSDHGEKLEALRTDYSALRTDMERHGRNTRLQIEDLPGAVAEAVTAAVVKLVSPATNSGSRKGTG